MCLCIYYQVVIERGPLFASLVSHFFTSFATFSRFFSKDSLASAILFAICSRICLPIGLFPFSFSTFLFASSLVVLARFSAPSSSSSFFFERALVFLSGEFFYRLFQNIERLLKRRLDGSRFPLQRLDHVVLVVVLVLLSFLWWSLRRRSSRHDDRLKKKKLKTHEFKISRKKKRESPYSLLFKHTCLNNGNEARNDWESNVESREKKKKKKKKNRARARRRRRGAC